MTFDSNVWEKVVRPDLCDGARSAVQAIHDAIVSGRVTGFISDSFATIEAIRKRDRFVYFANRATPMRVEWDEDGRGAQVVIAADSGDHPGLPEVQRQRLQEAFALGFRTLPSSRLGTLRPPELDDSSVMISLTEEQQTEEGFWALMQRIADTNAAIEARGVGRAPLQRIAEELRARSGLEVGAWFDGLEKAATPAEKKKIARAFAEWADGDSVALHIAYGIGIFCTNDMAQAAGRSVFDADNRAWLSATYGTQFMTAAELEAAIK